VLEWDEQYRAASRTSGEAAPQEGSSKVHREHPNEERESSTSMSQSPEVRK
jgi:hypothetical protein